MSEQSMEELKKENEELKKESEELKKENEELKKALENRIKELEMLPKHGDVLYLRDIVKRMTGFEILKCNDDLLEIIIQIAKESLNIMKNPENYKDKFKLQNISIPITSLTFPDKCDKKKRPNECGNYMESILDIAHANIISPKTSKGKLMSSAYPDRELKDQAYIEVKVFDVNSKDSSFRSFYLSTLDKITKSLPHILVAFSHKDGVLIDTKPEVIDLYDLKLKLKQEFNASNKDLYKVIISPNYTLEELDEIKGDGFKPGQKNLKKNKYKEICKNHGLGKGGSIEDIYQRLVDHLN
jgi:hypothetical protein